MDLQKIKALIDLMSDSHLSELELIENDARVKLVKEASRGAAKTTALRAPEDPVPPASKQRPPASAPEPLSRVVIAPMHGVLHLRPSPAEAPFTVVGADVLEGQVVCVIEAMKMFNTIETEWAGKISAILATDGKEVEVGQPLFRIE